MPSGRPRVLTDDERKQRNYENKKKWYEKQMLDEEYRKQWSKRVLVHYHANKQVSAN